MSNENSGKSNNRLQEGALSALKTPSNPPAQSKLVPLTPTAPTTQKEKA